MTSKVSAAFLASLSLALAVSSHETFGQAGHGAGRASASTHAQSLRSLARSPDRHAGRRTGAFWPLAGRSYWGPWYGQPVADFAPQIPTDMNYNYTYKQDVPWDWAHRYPPSYYALPPAPPPPFYAPSPGCPAQTVTVPSADGREQTVSIVRC